MADCVEMRNQEHYYGPVPAQALKNIEKEAQCPEKENTVRNKIFAIIPGVAKSAYVIAQHDGQRITCVVEKGVEANGELLRRLPCEVGRCEIAVKVTTLQERKKTLYPADVQEALVAGRFLQAGGVRLSMECLHKVGRLVSELPEVPGFETRDKEIAKAMAVAATFLQQAGRILR